MTDRSRTRTPGATARSHTRIPGTTARLGTKTPGATARSEAPIPVAASDTPPIGRTLSSNRVLAIAASLPKMRALRRDHPGSYAGAYLKGVGRWQVSYFSKAGKEIGQVIVSDFGGHVLGQWTGFQIAWSMARGYPGAFGRHADALYVWLPLCVLFFIPFFDWRKPLRLLHLDLLVLLSFSVSLAFFNHADIGLSTPLAYPPLLYLLGRMLWLALRRRRSPGEPSSPEDAASPGEPSSPEGRPARPRASAPRLLVPLPWLAAGVIFLLAFRVALNMTDSNVIDVGYAGVIGAQRILDGKPLYGGYPADNEHGDTYGPVNYEAYVPFRLLFGWTGRWDDLPAAHGAAVAFDLLAVALLFLLGRRVRGPGLGVVLAYAWVSYPFTLFALESNSNDTLVGALVLAAVLAASSPPARGALGALAGLTKFAPLALAPLLAGHGPRGRPVQDGRPVPDGRPRANRRRAWALCSYAAAFVIVAAIACLPALAHDSPATIWRQAIAYQANRESPFSVWGFYGGLGWAEHAVEGLAVLLAVGLALVPRRRDLVGLAAGCAAVLIALQLGASHWFYLYIPWFFGLAALALLEPLSLPAQPQGAASGPARSSLPAAASSSAPAPPSARGPLLRSQSAPASG
jgi:hypothetical protein